MELRFRRCSLRLNFSFFAVLAVMLLLRDRQATAVCFVSALLHECGHLVLLRVFGAHVRRVAFGAAGIVIERGDVCLLPGTKEALAALGGVFVNALLCALALLLRFRLNERLCQTLLWSNALLGALNLLPVYPLDLWRALHALLEDRLSPERTEPLLRRVSLCGCAAFCAFSLWYFLKIGRNLSLLAVCVYLLLLNLKRRSSDV